MGKIRIVVTQRSEGASFHAVKDRTGEPQKIKHGDVLDCFNMEPMKPLKAGNQIIARRYGYTLPQNVLDILTSDEAHQKWQEETANEKLASLQNQLHSKNNGNNSFVRHQIQQAHTCRYCGFPLRKTVVTTVKNENIHVYKCPHCKAAFQCETFEEVIA